MHRKSSVDPWASIESKRLSFAQAAHLYRRIAFGGQFQEIEAATAIPAGEVVDRLLIPTNSDDPLEQSFQQMKSLVAAGDLGSQLPAWWLYRMLHTKQPALERLTLFWHGHFATSAAKVGSAPLMLRQNETIRRHAWGRFGDLVLEISRDPAMLIYLDNTTNRRNRPNENYARELLELFCLGLGNYSEKDIKELARALSGWELRGERFQYNHFQHDPGEKQLFGRGGIESGEQAIAAVVNQPAAAEFIARKWIREFVSDSWDPDPTQLQPLADEFRATEFDLRSGLRKLLTSQLFYSDLAVGAKIRSPLELAVGTLRGLGGTSNAIELAEATRELGQALFFPPNVKGWDGGKQWINSASLIGRVNLIARLLGNQTEFVIGPRSQLDSHYKAETATLAVQRAADLFLARPLSDKQRDQLEKVVTSQRQEPSKFLAAVKALATLAEFQLA